MLLLGGRVGWLANSITFLLLTCLVSLSPGGFIEQFAFLLMSTHKDTV